MNEFIKATYAQFESAIEGDVDWHKVVELLPIFETHTIRLVVAQKIEAHREPFIRPGTVYQSQRCKMWANQTLRQAGLSHVTYWSR